MGREHPPDVGGLQRRRGGSSARRSRTDSSHTRPRNCGKRSSPSPRSGSASRTRPLSRCRPTSRPISRPTIRPSSSPVCSRTIPGMYPAPLDRGRREGQRHPDPADRRELLLRRLQSRVLRAAEQDGCPNVSGSGARDLQRRDRLDRGGQRRRRPFQIARGLLAPGRDQPARPREPRAHRSVCVPGDALAPGALVEGGRALLGDEAGSG